MATLADVARHAGVAASTVSYVLSGKRSVSEATKRRVERSIELLNYHPHAGARALASSRSNVLALFVPLRGDLYVPVMMDIAIGVVTTARAYGNDVLLLTSDEGPEGIRRIASSSRADAVIVTDIGMEDDRIALIRESGIDAVLIGVPADPAGLACVDLDFTEAGRLCVEHLAQLGHRTVAFIGEAERVYQRHIGFAERTLRGVRAGAAAWGVDLVHRPSEGTFEAAAGALARILEERPRTTGLIVQNEAIIAPLMSLLRTAGRAVPEDVSIVALCPDKVAEQTSPRLTSVNMPATELGTRAVELLMRRAGDGASGEVVLLPPGLTVRGSSTAVARLAADPQPARRVPARARAGPPAPPPRAGRVPGPRRDPGIRADRLDPVRARHHQRGQAAGAVRVAGAAQPAARLRYHRHPRLLGTPRISRHAGPVADRAGGQRGGPGRPLRRAIGVRDVNLVFTGDPRVASLSMR